MINLASLPTNMDEPTASISIRVILATTASFYGVSLDDIVSQRRDARIAIVRQIAMYAMRHLTPRSLPEIGLAIGGRDHTTALYAVKKIESMLAAEPDSTFTMNVHGLMAYLRRVAQTAPSVDACPFEAAERVGRDPKCAVNISIQTIRAMAAIVRAAKAEAMASMLPPLPEPKPVIIIETVLEAEIRAVVDAALLLERASPGHIKSAEARHASAVAALEKAAETHFNIKRSPK